jgi:hypothetical protein
VIFHPLAAGLQLRQINHTGLIRIDQPLDFCVQRLELAFETFLLSLVALVDHRISAALLVARLENITIRE